MVIFPSTLQNKTYLTSPSDTESGNVGTFTTKSKSTGDDLKHLMP